MHIPFPPYFYTDLNWDLRKKNKKIKKVCKIIIEDYLLKGMIKLYREYAYSWMDTLAQLLAPPGWLKYWYISFCGLIIFAIYKHELDEKPLITGLALFLGLSSSVLKGIHCSSSWPCSYQCWMGLSIVFKQLN